MKLKTPPSQKTSTSTMNTPIDQAGFAEKQIQVRSSRIGDKTKRELNMLKRNEETGVSNGHKVIKEEQCDISVGPKCFKKSFAARKKMKSIRLESEQEHPSCFKSSIFSATPRVVKKATLPPSKTVDRSFVGWTSLKLKVLVKSSPPSISSTGLFDPRCQEKIIKVGDKSNGGKEKAFGSLSTLPSTKSQLSRVSSMKLRKYRKVIPSFTENYHAKAGNFGCKDKTVRAFEPNLEKIDLKALRQKLRKHRSHSDRTEELKESGSQWSGSSETVLHREASQRTCRDGESELRSAPERNTDVNSEYKIGTPHKSNFSRSKMVKLQPENKSNPPIRFRFRQLPENICSGVTQYETVLVGRIVQATPTSVSERRSQLPTMPLGSGGSSPSPLMEKGIRWLRSPVATGDYSIIPGSRLPDPAPDILSSPPRRSPASPTKSKH
ncbi:hypothetical protein BHE74_00039946 [Ensete ventricosum]|nr:hypothetical protein BHE74_00039946 [Ensete ventricosum]